MILLVLAIVGLTLAALPFGLTALNLFLYRTPRPGEGRLPAVSILIPARNEEANIARSVTAALASQGVEVEVLVLDDHSTDRTATIVREIARFDARLRLLEAPPLPEGWAGKQHACRGLAEHAASPLLLFLDADVELAPDGVARAAGFLVRKDRDLVSGFPRQITGSPLEKLVIPLIHFVLLGYLPLPGMRLSKSEGFAAGCGQFFLVRREAYRQMGGHATIRDTFHDGIQLPRAFRRAGLTTDLFDATAVARCRMYRDAREVVLGLAKNAHEGMGGPVAIWVWSVLLLGGHVLPSVLVALGLVLTPEGAAALWFQISLLAMALGLATRLLLAVRFRQSLTGALAHPVGVAILVGIQWFARSRRRAGRGIGWKDRAAVS